jgi:urease accessory protein
VDPDGFAAADLIRAEPSLGRVGRDGCLQLRFERRAATTVLARCAYTLPLQVLAPIRLDDPALVVSVLNPTGGIVGGDRLRLEVAVGAGAHACLSTPSATRIYRTAGQTAEQRVRLRVAAGGTLEWVPDHTIAFAGSAFRQRVDIDLDPGGRLIFLDTFAAGRVARGEAWRFARLESSVTVREGARCILRDRFVLGHDGPWACVGGSDGSPYFGSFVLVGEADMAVLARAITCALARAGASGGATPGPRGGLVGRVLAPSAPVLVDALDALWGHARGALLGLPPLSLRKG